MKQNTHETKKQLIPNKPEPKPGQEVIPNIPKPKPGQEQIDSRPDKDSGNPLIPPDLDAGGREILHG
jgi:hypothetical protein